MNNLYADDRLVAVQMTRSEILDELRRMPIQNLSPAPTFTELCNCEYCNSVVDSTYINCPNCGAPINRMRKPIQLEWNYMGMPVQIVEDDS